jgi:hypothetical protein
MNKWDEKNLTEPKPNSENFIGNISKTITNVTKNDCEQSVCKNIGWTRNCPMCNKTIHYKTCAAWGRANTKKSCCKSCPKIGNKIRLGKVFGSDTIEKIRKASTGRKHCKETIEKIKNANVGKHVSQKTKDLLRQKNVGKKMSESFSKKQSLRLIGNTYSIGNKWTEERRVQHSEKINKSRSTGDKLFSPNYNEVACIYFDWLNMWMGWDGQHALYGGERCVLGYYLDYYEPTYNIVIEWDEAYHKNRKSYDEMRQKIIKNTLNCRFFRYNELTGEFVEV